MAIAIIKTKDIIHDAHHDLESFYWLLVWLVLRHTKYKYYSGQEALKSLFGGVTANDAYKDKGWWITCGDELTVEGNKPLSLLLENFRRLCKLNYTEVERMTHASVLKIFKEALGRDDWPSNDKALPYKPSGASQHPPPHQVQPVASIPSGRVESLHGSDAAPIVYPRIARMAHQRDVVSESDLAHIQRQIPGRYAGPIVGALAPAPAVDNPLVPRAMLLHDHAVSESAAPFSRRRLSSPESPTPRDRASRLRPLSGAALDDEEAPEDVPPAPSSEVRLRLERVASQRARSRASTPPSHLSEDDSSDAGSQLVESDASDREPEWDAGHRYRSVQELTRTLSDPLYGDTL